MSMLSCRVLCLLAIVLCCVGVAHAAAAPAADGKSRLIKDAEAKVEETLKLKAECEKATNAAREAANEALVFAHDIKGELEKIAAALKEVEKRKSEGFKLIDKATKAAEKAEKVRDETITSKEKAIGAVSFLEGEQVFENATKADDAAKIAISNATDAIDVAKLHAEEVKNVLKKLDVAVAAA